MASISYSPLMGCILCSGSTADSEPDNTEATYTWPEGVEDQGDIDSLLAAKEHNVGCIASIGVVEVDVKNSRFSLRMHCFWGLRTNLHAGANGDLGRVPGIRMPGMKVTVEESRIYRCSTEEHFLHWQGSSIFRMEGYQKFHIKDFPFDRQVISLKNLDFVWRTSMGDTEYFELMNVTWLRVKINCTLPQWKASVPTTVPTTISESAVSESAAKPGGIIRCKSQVLSDALPDQKVTSRFTIQIFIERGSRFYLWQIFFVSTLITIAAISPLGAPPGDIGDRLSVYAGGILALVAFKYGVLEHLPSVPYLTTVDVFMLCQILCIVVCTVESLVAHRIAKIEDPEGDDIFSYSDTFENVLLAILVFAWFLAFLRMRRKVHDKSDRTEWSKVLQHVESLSGEIEDSIHP